MRVAHVTTVDLTLRFLLLPQLGRLRAEGFEVVGISAPGPWTGDLERAGIRHIAWGSATRAWDPLADVRAFFELLGIFRRERFDIVHTHNPKPGILGRIAARRAGVPVVVNTVHGLYATPDDPPAKRFAVLALERMAARASDLELYQSAEDLAWARRSGVVPASRSVLLGNGTDLEWFHPAAVPQERVARIRKDLGLGANHVVVGTVGRLVAEKGYRELFAAARRVRATRRDVRFLVVGSRDADKATAIHQHEIDRAAADVVFTGWRDDVRDLMGVMDVFVLPSWREGVPRSVIEAAAMGRPLVATDIRGCREVVRDGEEGFLVPRREPERLAGAIGRLVDDPALRRSMGDAARKRAEDRFDERRVMDAVAGSYRRLLARAGRAQSSAFRVRTARAEDADVIARMHRVALPEAFLPLLGHRFLRGLYRAMAGDREAVVLVAENGDGVVGFAAGAPSVQGFYRRFRRRHGFTAAMNAAPALWRRDVRRRLRETMRYPQGLESMTEAELLSIAVKPGHGRTGVGRALAEDLLRRLADRGAEEVRVVVASSNAPGNRFYERLGFRLAREIQVHDGAASNVWVVRCRA